MRNTETRHPCATREKREVDEKNKILFGFGIGSLGLSWTAGTAATTRPAIATAATFPASSEISGCNESTWKKE